MDLEHRSDSVEGLTAHEERCITSESRLILSGAGAHPVHQNLWDRAFLLAYVWSLAV